MGLIANQSSAQTKWEGEREKHNKDTSEKMTIAMVRKTVTGANCSVTILTWLGAPLLYLGCVDWF